MALFEKSLKYQVISQIIIILFVYFITILAEVQFNIMLIIKTESGLHLLSKIQRWVFFVNLHHSCDWLVAYVVGYRSRNMKRIHRT